MASNLIRGDQLFMGWKRDLLSGKPRVRWALANEDCPLNAIKAEPGSVTGLGGGPGSGKTAVIMQMMVDGLRLSDDLRVLVAKG